MEENLIKLLLTNWIELKSDNEKKKELLKELENSNKLRWSLGRSTSGNDILGIEFYSPNRKEYSVNLNELINRKYPAFSNTLLDAELRTNSNKMAKIIERRIVSQDWYETETNKNGWDSHG